MTNVELGGITLPHVLLLIDGCGCSIIYIHPQVLYIYKPVCMCI